MFTPEFIGIGLLIFLILFCLIGLFISEFVSNIRNTALRQKQEKLALERLRMENRALHESGLNASLKIPERIPAKVNRNGKR